MARLVVLSEGFTGKSYELKVEQTTVGRVEDNSFCIPDGSLSSHHAEVLLKGDDIAVRDLDSTNGSFIGPIGQKIVFSISAFYFASIFFMMFPQELFNKLEIKR